MQTPDRQHLHETVIRREELVRGHFLHVLRDTVRLPNGGEALREYIIHPGAVMVIPLLDDGRLVMEWQYRHPMGRAMLEFPAGKLDAGESVWTCAQRELREETGYCATEWARAGHLNPVIAYANEFIEIWFARGLTLGERGLDDEEFLDVVTLSPAEVAQHAQQGTMTDAKSLIALLWLQNWQAGNWPLTWHSADTWAQAVAGAKPPVNGTAPRLRHMPHASHAAGNAR